MPQRNSYGWFPGLPSKRFPALSLPGPMVALHAQVDLKTTGYEPPIWDQGQTSSCTGHGTGRGFAFARAKAGLSSLDPSRLFPYWNARVGEGDADQDGGAAIGDVVAATLQYGDCPYTDYPTDPSLVTVQPAANVFADATPHVSTSVTRVTGTTPGSWAYHFEHCMDVLGVGVIIGVTLYESFESAAVAKSGIIPMPGHGESVIGGHCMWADAYDHPGRRARLANSWNTDWGQAGYCWIPYDYLFDSDYAADFHAILAVKG